MPRMKCTIRRLVAARSWRTYAAFIKHSRWDTGVTERRGGSWVGCLSVALRRDRELFSNHNHRLDRTQSWMIWQDVFGYQTWHFGHGLSMMSCHSTVFSKICTPTWFSFDTFNAAYVIFTLILFIIVIVVIVNRHHHICSYSARTDKIRLLRSMKVWHFLFSFLSSFFIFFLRLWRFINHLLTYLLTYLHRLHRQTRIYRS